METTYDLLKYLNLVSSHMKEQEIQLKCQILIISADAPDFFSPRQFLHPPAAPPLSHCNREAARPPQPNTATDGARVLVGTIGSHEAA